MKKQDYFETRLVNDYHSFLLSDSPNACKRLVHEVSTMIENLLYDGSKSIYVNCERRIATLLETKFGVKSDMVGWQKLPKDFKWYDVCTSVNKKYNTELERLFAKLEMDKKLTALLQPRVECWVWTEGIVPTAKMLSKMPAVIDKMVQAYRPSHLDDYPLKKRIGEMFVDAKRVTFREWLNKSNDQDIRELKKGMKEYTQCLLYATLYSHMQKLGEQLTGIPLWGLASHLDKAYFALRERDAEQVSCEIHPEWEKEYKRKAPVDFYFRNVESITASGAFHLLVLQAIARNETQLVNCGYLRPMGVNGTEPEICIFSNPAVDFTQAFEVLDETMKTLVN